MEAILIYLYQDKVPFSCNVEDVAFICQVLVAADHILVDGLKSMCEVTLAHLLTLKNVSELYKFSDTYSAYQLRSYCLKYIVPNISALLESRALDTVDDDLFTDIQLTYWDMTPIVLERSVGIPIKYPDLEQLQSILENVGVPSEEEYFSKNGNLFKSQPKKEGIGTPKKRKPGKRYKLKKSSIDESDGSMAKLLLDSNHMDNLEAKSEILEAAISLGTADEEPANFSQGFVEEDVFMMVEESKLKETPSTLIPSEKKSSVFASKQEIVVSPQIEKEFPSLTGDMYQPSPTSSTRVPKQR
ncbi:hypothetical protein J437_LFUL008090 [Ladona fulva]|uniref:BTB domain-containing protein n=1 Tax=Ladona fulva TaxID=123851 RepID=A0A8K0KBX1_LADFU|nr:hypothetical protein J437_LFUL008090 [Ladona fulva]